MLQRVESPAERLRALLARHPVILAPMEDVTDAVFRRLCRSLGADICVTEFVNAERLTGGAASARRKIVLPPGDHPTGIQIYGADPERLTEAARIAEAAAPAFVDINCGCWIPKIARRGAGAGWLRDPAAMVAMARRIVGSVALPVTVKTRIGLGDETTMPIVDLARRLEDAGVAAITLHCRTAHMRHDGAADWSWARRVREVVSIPVIVNGDVRSAADAARSLDETGCAGVMVGRAAIDHPFIFREARALLDGGAPLPPPTVAERLALTAATYTANAAQRGESIGVRCTRRHLAGYLGPLDGGAALRRALLACDTLAGCLALLEPGRAAALLAPAGRAVPTVVGAA
jgi:tRNA-dihydrouridine synthase B